MPAMPERVSEYLNAEMKLTFPSEKCNIESEGVLYLLINKLPRKLNGDCEVNCEIVWTVFSNLRQHEFRTMTVTKNQILPLLEC